jgi:hypothetical protein
MHLGEWIEPIALMMVAATYGFLFYCLFGNYYSWLGFRE